MIDILKDILKHTHGLGFLDLLKLLATVMRLLLTNGRGQIPTGGDLTNPSRNEWYIWHAQMGKLDIRLKCPEYKEKAKITVLSGERNGATVPTGIHFENEKGDFKNDYRFMNAEIINEKLKTVKFKGVKWDVEIEPLWQVYKDPNFQATANTEHNSFVVRTEDGN